MTYLIYKKNIEFTPTIEKYVQDSSLDNVWEMFYDGDKASSTLSKKLR